MTPEQAFVTPSGRPKDRVYKIKTPQGEKTYVSLIDAHNDLKQYYQINAYSTVVSYLKVKNLTIEQAFGFEKAPWEENYKETDLLVSKGYTYVGQKNGQSKPVIMDSTKEIFASVKLFAKSYGLEYTTVAERIKKGLSPEDVLRKAKHPAVSK